MGYYDFPHTRNYDTDLGYLIDWFKTNKNKIEENTAITIEKALTATEEAIKAYNSATNASNSATSASNSAELALELKNQTEALKNLMQNKIDQIDTNTNRINNLATIDQGSITTTGDAELVDIRVGANGTTYPSAGDSVRGQVSELKSVLSELEDCIGVNPNIVWLENGYIPNWDTDTIEQNAAFKYSEPIYLKKGTVIKAYLKGYLTNVTLIAQVDVSETSKFYRKKVVSTDSEAHWIEYTIAENGYYAFSTDKSAGTIKMYIPGIISDIVDLSITNSLENTSNGELLNGKNVQAKGDGRIQVVDAGGAYKACKLIVNDEIKAKVYCVAGTDTKYEVGYFCVDENMLILSQYNNETYGFYTIEFDIPEGTKEIYVNNNGNGNVTPTINAYSYVNKLNAYTIDESNRIFNTKNNVDLSLFSKFGVIGDSYASGALYYNGDVHDNYAISWGQIMARKHGTNCTNYSKGGLSTRTWLTDNNGLPKLLSSSEEDIYYLALGINDWYQLGESYLGTIEDITNHSSYSDYADTFYGNYGKIIEQIMNHSIHAKLVMFTCADTSELAQRFNNAIIEIANHYNIPYIVQDSDDFFKSDIYTKKVGGHPRAIAYSGMACAFERLLNKCIEDNWEYFKNCFMY